MRTTAEPNHTGFILIRGDTGRQTPLLWQNPQKFRPSIDNQLDEVAPPQSYSQKKTILGSLTKMRSFSQGRFNLTDGFSVKERSRGMSTAAVSTVSIRKRKPFVYANKQRKAPLGGWIIESVDELTEKTKNAKRNGGKCVAVVWARRNGLRFKLSHILAEFCQCNKTNHQHSLKKFGEQVKNLMQELGTHNREIYFFHLGGRPVHSLNQIQERQYVLLVDNSPKLNLSYDLHFRVFGLAQQIEEALSRVDVKGGKQKSKDQDGNNAIYDWQRIGNVKQYVEKLTQDPENRLNAVKENEDDLARWYQQKFRQQIQGDGRAGDKNLLFESKNHYPEETSHRKMLEIANERVQGLLITNNKHKYISKRIDLMMEQVRRDKQIPLKDEGKLIKFMEPILSKRDLLAHLDKKNSLLSTQNIPYLIEKYGLNRFQLYNLYNLYKSLQKVSALRGKAKNSKNVEGGIDRQTLDGGLKGLQMNPGDQLIRNICHFGDMVSWQQFIKIISISLRKTPQQKLTAILKSISSFQNGYLTRHQIGIMIGNSLHKLFDAEQRELREYFTEMAMKQLQEGVKGRVDINNLKQKVLNKGSDNLNMVSFLILNT